MLIFSQIWIFNFDHDLIACISHKIVEAETQKVLLESWLNIYKYRQSSKTREDATNT